MELSRVRIITSEIVTPWSRTDRIVGRLQLHNHIYIVDIIGNSQAGWNVIVGILRSDLQQGDISTGRGYLWDQHLNTSDKQ